MANINPHRSTWTMTLATTLTFSIGLLGGAWWARGVVDEIVSEHRRATHSLETKIDTLSFHVDQQIRSVRNQVTNLQREAWLLRDQNSWAGRFRWENRAINLFVPEPKEWRDYRPPARELDNIPDTP